MRKRASVEKARRRYERSEKGRARRAHYDHTARGHARHIRYNHSALGKARHTRHLKSPRGDAARKAFRRQDHYVVYQRVWKRLRKLGLPTSIDGVTDVSMDAYLAQTF